MTPDILRNDPGNGFVAIAERTRSTSGTKLILAEFVGLFAALGIWIWVPGQWALALPFLSLAALGLWGIIDHVMMEGRGTLSRPAWVALRSTRTAIAVFGLAAAAASVWGLLGVAIGTFVL